MSVGALFFLRFLCPALVDPVGWGLLEKQPGERGKRGLILVAKVLQVRGGPCVRVCVCVCVLCMCYSECECECECECESV